MKEASSPAPVVEAGQDAAVSFRARRRRPGMAALGIALVAAGGLGGFVAWEESGQRVQVLAVAREVPAGEVIEDADVSVVAVSLDPVVSSLKASDRAEVVGRRAAVPLLPGALVSAGQVTDRPLIEAGEQLVGIGLKPSQLPASPLAPGTGVLVVFTAGESGGEQQQGQARQETPAVESVKARVVRVGEREQATGEVVVDVAVPPGEGPRLAVQAATGGVALVVDARKGGGR
ncbi:SAF domain-containing protein [Streptomyces sp. NPDC002835]